MNMQTILMISIFQEVYPLGTTKMSPEDYFDYFGFEIDRVGRILRYLGLAQDDRSDLCWKPTPILMKIIAERLAHPPEKRKSGLLTEDDRNSVRSLIMYATGDVPDEESWDATEFCCSVLVALGLVREGVSGEFKPTPRLHEVMWYASLQTPQAARA